MNTKKGSAAILYHYPCPDGVFAALAAHLYFKATSLFSPLFFPNTVYSPLRLEDLPLNDITDLYLLDFVGPPGFVHQVSTKVPRVIVLDHHKTALESLCSDDTSLGENVTKVIDMERSGATIAFDYFKEKLVNPDAGVVVNQPSVIGEFDRARRVFNYIEDVDLWRWRLQNSKAFSSGLKDLKIEFDARINPSLFDQLLSLDLDAVISQGTVSLSHKQKLIDDCLSNSYEIALGNGAYGHCLAVNADAALSELRSELGHQLATKSQKLKLRKMIVLKDIVPAAQNNIDTKFIFLEKGKTTLEGQNKVCLALVADETAAVHVQLWGDECDAFDSSDIIYLTNGIFSYQHGNLILRAGKRGKLEKIGEFTMSYVETPNMSEIHWVRDSTNSKYMQERVISPHSRIFPPIL